MVKKNLGIDGPIYVAPDVNVYAEKPKEIPTLYGRVKSFAEGDPNKSYGLIAPISKDKVTGEVDYFTAPMLLRGLVGDLAKSIDMPARAMRGERISPEEATLFGLTLTGGSIVAPKPKGVVATMGIGKTPQTQKIKPEKTKFGTYSKLEENILNLPQDKYQAKDVLSKLKKSEGVKEDELKWTGIEDLLKGKDKVTKQELVDHIQQNRVNIAEMPLGVMDRSLQKPGLFSVSRVTSNFEKRKEMLLEQELIELQDQKIRITDEANITPGGMPNDEDEIINLINLKADELRELKKSHVYNGSVIGERSERGLVNTMDEIEKSVDELIKPQALRDTIDVGKGFEFGLKENPIASISPTTGIRNQNSIKKDTYWAIGSPEYGYKIMRNNELAFDASNGVTSDAFKKDFDKVFGEKLASDGFPLMEVSSLNNKYLKLDEPKMQTVINNLNGKVNVVGQVKYPKYTLPPQKVEKENPFGRKYMDNIMIKDPEANYREIPVGFDDASKKRIEQKQSELGEGFGILDTEGTKGYSQAHYGMGEIGFYNVQDRNLEGFGKTFSVEHLQSDYGAAKGKLRKMKREDIISYDKDLGNKTDITYTDSQLAKLGLDDERISDYYQPPDFNMQVGVVTPYNYLIQSVDNSHFDMLRRSMGEEGELIIPPLDKILKVLTPEQRKAYDDAVKSIDDEVNKIDFGSAKKGKTITEITIPGDARKGSATDLIPSAPLVTNEPDVIKLIIRTALQRAAREDYDAISFPTSDLMKTIRAINPGKKGVTVYDRLLPKEINKIMKKIGGKKYDDGNYFTKKEFYSTPGSPDKSSPMNPASHDGLPPNDNFLRVIPLSKEIKKKLLEQGAETFKEGGSIIASNPYGNYEPRAI